MHTYEMDFCCFIQFRKQLLLLKYPINRASAFLLVSLEIKCYNSRKLLIGGRKMFNRILWFLLLIAFAALSILAPSGYKTIECTNSDKICKTYNINSVLKLKTLKKTVKVDAGYGQSWHIMGIGQNNVKNLSCFEQPYTITRRDGSVEHKVKYLLVPINKHSTLYALNEYLSNTSCEIDRVAIQTYLSSNNNEPFIYVVKGSWLRYLWYLVSVFFVFIAFAVLFNSQEISEAEERRIKESMTEEKFEQIQNNVNNIMKQASNIDKAGAANINKIENQVNKYFIDKQNDGN